MITPTLMQELQKFVDAFEKEYQGSLHGASIVHILLYSAAKQLLQ